jgi:hypothetical protein
LLFAKLVVALILAGKVDERLKARQVTGGARIRHFKNAQLPLHYLVQPRLENHKIDARTDMMVNQQQRRFRFVGCLGQAFGIVIIEGAGSQGYRPFHQFPAPAGHRNYLR